MHDATMIRFCPNCSTERSLVEMFCEGSVDDQRCDWSLAEVPIRPIGWRPAVVIPAQPPVPSGQRLSCVNGHPMEEGDLICAQCGADVAAGSDETSTEDQPPPMPARQIEAWERCRRAGSALVRSGGRAHCRELARAAGQSPSAFAHLLKRRQEVPMVRALNAALRAGRSLKDSHG